jgi:hypothetical protein
MTSRDHFDHVAAGIASLAAGDPERLAAEEHARGCARCAEALRQSKHLMTLIDTASAPSPSPEALDRLSQSVTRATRKQRSSAWLALAAVLATSLLLALATGNNGGLALVRGLHCAAIELLAAFVPYGVLFYSAVRQHGPVSAPAFAATAAAGALSAQFYLLFRCADRLHTPHLLVTHTGAVVLAAVLGWIGSTSVLPRTRSGSRRRSGVT